MEISLSNLRPNKRKHRRRIGRGNASGHGTYSGRGLKGQKARSGGNIRPGFEGGRMPLIRQLPKSRGFLGWQPKKEVVNLGQLEKHFTEQEMVTPAKLQTKGLIKKASLPVKILGEGKITKPLKIVADAFSKTAEDAIKKVGGQIQKR